MRKFLLGSIFFTAILAVFFVSNVSFDEASAVHGTAHFLLIDVDDTTAPVYDSTNTESGFGDCSTGTEDDGDGDIDKEDSDCWDGIEFKRSIGTTGTNFDIQYVVQAIDDAAGSPGANWDLYFGTWVSGVKTVPTAGDAASDDVFFFKKSLIPPSACASADAAVNVDWLLGPQGSDLSDDPTLDTGDGDAIVEGRDGSWFQTFLNLGGNSGTPFGADCDGDTVFDNGPMGVSQGETVAAGVGYVVFNQAPDPTISDSAATDIVSVSRLIPLPNAEIDAGPLP